MQYEEDAWDNINGDLVHFGGPVYEPSKARKGKGNASGITVEQATRGLKLMAKSLNKNFQKMYQTVQENKKIASLMHTK